VTFRGGTNMNIIDNKSTDQNKLYSKFNLVIKVLLFSICCFFILNINKPIHAEELPRFNIITEDWAPYQFEKDGKIHGIAVDLLELMLQIVGSKQNRKDIKLYPWARGYHVLINEENTILFSTTRTSEREELLKWVGPIFSYSTILVGLKSKKMKIKTKKDLHKYRIGTIINDSSELFMKRLGVPIDKLHRNNNAVNNTRKLELDRIDLVVTNWVEFKIIAKDLNINTNLYETVYTVDTSIVSYAFHKTTPEWIIKKFQKALNKIKEEGKYNEILNKYSHLM
jgi:polar amino acid transport system substrate-binding protein